jgi:hypothetical protein
MYPLDMEDRPGVSTPVLGPALLARIHELNYDYLELLRSHRQSTAPPATGSLPRKVLNALAELPDARRRSLAAAPYTLYSLGFEDQELWRAKSPSSSPSNADWPYAAILAATTPPQAFCEVALFHAWHVAVLHPFAARMIYSLPDATAARLVVTPLWQLRCVARNAGALLLPRWPTNPCFWSDLVKFAADGDERRLRTAQLLGSQLIAAELHAAVGTHEVSGVMLPVLSPRLRARRPRFAAG